MRVLCRHGHFSFYPNGEEDISRFCSYFNFALEREDDFYTFSKLKGAPRYSIAGESYLGITAVKTYEGRGPWEVMRENGFVYNIATKLLVLKASILATIEIPDTGSYFLGENFLIQPGSRDGFGNQVMSYSAEFIQSIKSLRISEFSHE
jgi:hypothetical protein